MTSPIHLGFSGTRHFASDPQLSTVRELVIALRFWAPLVAHHGLCVGADEQFHGVCREPDILAEVIGHPGPDWPDGEFCAYTICGRTLDPLPHMKRNAAIVAASHIMIAAPFENTPQPRGGTWATIGMARKALRAGKLRALYVVGREGQLLEHEEWPT